MDDQTQAFMDQVNAIHAARELKRAEDERVLSEKKETARKIALEVFRDKLLKLGLDVHPEREVIKIDDIRLEFDMGKLTTLDPDEIRRKANETTIKVFVGNLSQFSFAKDIEEFVTALEYARYFQPD